MPAFRAQLVVRFYCICVFVALCMLLVIFYVRYVPQTITPNAQLVSGDAFNIVLGTLQIGKKSVYVKGHAIEKGASIQKYDIKVLFKAADGTYYYLPTQFVRRPDVTAHFNDGHKYDASGFTVYGLSPRLIAKGPFHVYVLYNNDDKNVLIDMGEAR